MSHFLMCKGKKIPNVYHLVKEAFFKTVCVEYATISLSIWNMSIIRCFPYELGIIFAFKEHIHKLREKKYNKITRQHIYLKLNY